ncbi:MAG: hypothetical protein E6R07_07565 [Nevskiaceae bacterium]|nr:MAG: hypothetical protein E6R07_07565 [Nevskiaceae bacterium]
MNQTPRPSLVRLPPNTQGRDWFVGDIHGKLAMLYRALEAAKFDPTKDRLIAVGDLVDRGHQSMEMLQLFARAPWAHSVLGNHEVMCLRSLLGESSQYVSHDPWLSRLDWEERPLAVEVMSRLPIALEVPLADGRRCGVVHAELPPQAPWSVVEKARLTDEDFDDPDERALIACLLWARRRFRLALKVRQDPQARSVSMGDRLKASILLQPAAGIDLVVAGHSVIDEDYRPLQVANYLWIDTGCGYGNGRLSLVSPVEGAYVQVHERTARLRTLPAPVDVSGFVLPEDQAAEVLARVRAAGTQEDWIYELGW